MCCGQFPAQNKNDCSAIEAYCRICSQKRYHSIICGKNKSRVKEIKDEKEEQQFLGLVTLENVYAIREDNTTD